MKSKLYYTFSLITLPLVMFAQIGIGTESPTRTLDVNGDLRIRKTENVNSNTAYDRVLVVNNDGEIDAWNKAALKEVIENLEIENKKNVEFLSSNNVQTEEMPCGKFAFRFAPRTSGSTSNIPTPQMRILNASTSAITVYYTGIRKRNNSNNQFNTTNAENSRSGSITANGTIAFAANNTDFKNISTQFQSNNIEEFYITYPESSTSTLPITTNIYRVTFFNRDMSSTQKFYSIICEKF